MTYTDYKSSVIKANFYSRLVFALVIFSGACFYLLLKLSNYSSAPVLLNVLISGFIGLSIISIITFTVILKRLLKAIETYEDEVIDTYQKLVTDIPIDAAKYKARKVFKDWLEYPSDDPKDVYAILGKHLLHPTEHTFALIPEILDQRFDPMLNPYTSSYNSKLSVTESWSGIS